MRDWRGLSVEERIEVHRRANALYLQSRDLSRTWQEVKRHADVSVSQGTIRKWVRNESDPARKFLGRIITTASPDLAYSILAAKGDGCTGKRENGEKGLNYNIEFRVRDLDFAINFASSASKALNRSSPYTIRVDKVGFYCVTIHSKALFELMGKIPSSSSDCRRHLMKTHLITRMGIRGFFDAEGGPSVSINHRGEFLGKIVAGNSDLNLMRLVYKLLRAERIASISRPSRLL